MIDGFALAENVVIALAATGVPGRLEQNLVEQTCEFNKRSESTNRSESTMVGFNYG